MSGEGEGEGEGEDEGWGSRRSAPPSSAAAEQYGAALERLQARYLVTTPTMAHA